MKGKFVARIKELREQKGWNRRRLAAEAQLNPSTIGRIEKGQVEPEPRTLRDIAAALDADFGELEKLLTEDEDAPSIHPKLLSILRRMSSERQRALVEVLSRPNQPIAEAEAA